MNSRKDVLDLMKKKPKLRKGEECHREMMKAFYCWHGATIVGCNAKHLEQIHVRTCQDESKREEVEEIVGKQMSL